MTISDTPKPPRPKEVMYNETPSLIVDHPFEPKGDWWSLCKQCNLAESAHAETTKSLFRYYSDDVPEVYE